MAIESVLTQIGPSYELIVVDDGSTDDTPGQVRQYEGRVDFYRQSQKGVAAARNYGARVSRGRYLAFLDSDDLWLPRKLGVQTQFMQNHSSAKICQTEEIWLRRGVRVNPRKRHAKPSGDIFHRSLELCLVSPSAVMIDRPLFDSLGGFDESLPVCEDYDLWLRIARNHEVHLIPDALVIKHGGHSDQLSRSTWGLDRFRIKALTKLLREDLTAEQRLAVIDTIRSKSAILAQGARKRGHYAQAQEFEAGANWA